MDLFLNGTLDTRVFSAELRNATQDFKNVLFAAIDTQSVHLESTHLLMVLTDIKGGVTQRTLARFNVPPASLRSGLASCVTGCPDALPPEELTDEGMDATALAALEAARNRCIELGVPRITEPILLAGVLQNVTAEVSELCGCSGLYLDQWRESVEILLEPKIPLQVFDDNEVVCIKQFSPSGKKVLQLTVSEAEALGYALCEPRHLLLALLLYEGGTTH